MAKLIDIDGKKVVSIEKQIELNDLESQIEIIQRNIDSIDYNMKGLQQRKENLVRKLNDLNVIKESLKVKKAGPIGPA